MSNHSDPKYLVLLSIHGLIRGHELELGRDADTGGQTKYVVDLARALARHDDIGRVDLITRRVVDEAVSDDYAWLLETLSDKARIIRIDAGPEEYIPKEQLWDHLDSFTDNLTNWFSEQADTPDFVHSHYADAGYVGMRLSNHFGVPLIHTGHSLGRDKRKRLLAKGLSPAEVESTYNMTRRIDAEEEILANAELVVTSTRNEIESQYGLYDYYVPERMSAIPPGTDLSLFRPPEGEEATAFAAGLGRFLRDPQKPLILTLCRPDERKNILTLISAFGESEELQQAANLLIVAGNRDDLRNMESGAQSVLTNILVWIDRYNLYGKVAVPKAHLAREVPAIYRLAARSGGVFVNPALTEPFGLTLLEAAASGLPLVATENGGPVDIIANCRNGALVDPMDTGAITRALLELLQDKRAWLQASRNGIEGVRKHYSWEAHVNTYLEKIAALPGKSVPVIAAKPKGIIRYRDRAIFSDLDQNLAGEPEDLKRLAETIGKHRKRAAFGIATGRRIDTALAFIRQHSLPMPDVLITSLGTRIHYGQQLIEDDYWADHIDYNWSAARLRRILDGTRGLELQPPVDQAPFKLSYYYDEEKAPSVEELTAKLLRHEITANIILSFGKFLDFVPSRASKGQALRYVSQQLEIPLENILVAGGSGADEDMMRGNMLAVVVANRHDEELSQLVDQERIFFAGKEHALGILEAIDHYDFYGACKVPEESNQ